MHSRCHHRACACCCRGGGGGGGYDDEYQLEDLEVGPVDYIKPLQLPSFRKAWEELDPSTEISDDYGAQAPPCLAFPAAQTRAR